MSETRTQICWWEMKSCFPRPCFLVGQSNFCCLFQCMWWSICEISIQNVILSRAEVNNWCKHFDGNPIYYYYDFLPSGTQNLELSQSDPSFQYGKYSSKYFSIDYSEMFLFSLSCSSKFNFHVNEIVYKVNLVPLITVNEILNRFWYIQVHNNCPIIYPKKIKNKNQCDKTVCDAREHFRCQIFKNFSIFNSLIYSSWPILPM